MKIFHLLLTFLFFLSVNSQLYIQSNHSTPTNGLTVQTPLSNITIGINLLLNQTGGDLILLPSSTVYSIASKIEVNQNISIIGDPDYQNTLLLDGSIEITQGMALTLKWIKVTRSTISPINELFLLNSQSNLTFERVYITGFSLSLQVNNFARGSGIIYFKNSTISNNVFDTMDCFIEISDKSRLLFRFTIISNSTMRKSSFLRVWDSSSLFNFNDSIAENLILNVNNENSDNTAFLLSNAFFIFTNSSFSNLSLNSGFFVGIRSGYPDSLVLIFQKCYFINMNSQNSFLMSYLNWIDCSITFEDVYFYNNTLIVDHGSIFFIDNGDYTRLNFTKTIFRNNFAMVMKSYNTESINFEDFYIWDHNIRNSTEHPLFTDCFSYIENTIYLYFNNFSINGAYSNRDLAGLIVHINSGVVYRKNNYIKNLMEKGVPLIINFTQCLFTRTNSINLNWMDKGSAISFHSDLLMTVNFNRVFIIDNINDLGATCMESYGQLSLKLFISDSFFINNRASSGSPCFSFYVVSLSLKNCFFYRNSLITLQNEIIYFKEGTKGGAMYGEIDSVLIMNSEFKENQAYQGGVFYFVVTTRELTNLTIVQSNFTGNKAKFGGVFSITNIYTKINMEVNTSNFLINQAFSGGCFYIAFNSETSSVVINNNIFKGNSGLKGGVAFISTDGFQALFIYNIYDSNIAWNFTYLPAMAYGGVYYLSEEASNLLNANNVYLNNTSFHAGGVCAINRGIMSEDSSTFLGNTALDEGGTIFIGNAGVCYLFNSVVNGEKSIIWGGSIYVCENSILFLKNSIFKNCYSRSGGTFYFENYQNITLVGSYFLNNSAYEGGVAVIDSSGYNITIISCYFQENPTQQYLFRISSIQGFITFSQITVENNDCSFMSVANAFVIFQDSNISNQNCKNSITSCIISLKDSTVILKNLEIVNTTLHNDGQLFYYEVVNSLYRFFDLEGVKVMDILGISKNSCGNIVTSKIEIRNSSFISTGYGCFLFSYSNVSINNVTFDNIDNKISRSAILSGSDYGSYIYLQYGYITLINNTNFINNFQGVVLNGGAIKALNGWGLLKIINSVFYSNQANSMGGAIYIYHQLFNINNCIFENNNAQTGGAIYFQSELSNNSIEYISNNTFKNNSANLEGGGIYFSDNLTNLQNNTFQNNNALYGSDIASFPVYLRLRIYNASNITQTLSKLNKDHLNDSMVLFDSAINDINEFIIENYPTGDNSPLAFVFDLLDYYNKTINSINSGLGHLRSLSVDYIPKSKQLNDGVSNNSLYDFTNKKVFIQGDVDAYNQNGSFFFSSLKIHATPTSYINLFITNDELSIFYPDIIGNNKTFVNINGSIGLILTIHLKDCVNGELYLLEENYCSVCPVGRFSLTANAENCKDCPNHVTCYGGNNISVEPGYWRNPDPDVLLVHKCSEYEAVCLGGLNNECEEGYKGPLCSLCKIDSLDNTSYTKLGKYCVICMNNLLNSLVLISILIAYLIMLFMMIKSNMKVTVSSFICFTTDQKISPSTSVFLKILVDHIQLLGITENIGFEVPKYFLVTSDIISNSVYFLQQMLSFDCFLKHRNFTDNADNSLMFMRVMCVALLPYFSVFCLIFAWFLYYKRIKKTPNTKKKVISQCVASIIVTIFLIQPTILNLMSNMIGCITLGKYSFVLADKSLTCWGSDHLFIVLVFAIPSLAVWIILVPLYCLYDIAKNRKQLKDEETVLKFGFLYNGFHESTYYWGFVKYFQKVAIILIGLIDIEVSVKMLSLLVILIFSVSYNKFKTAYVHAVFNQLEHISNSVVLITLLLSLYCLLGVEENTQATLFAIIFISNIFFIVLWIKIILVSKKKDMYLAMKTIYKKSITSVLSKSKKILPKKDVKLQNIPNNNNKKKSIFAFKKPKLGNDIG